MRETFWDDEKIIKKEMKAVSEIAAGMDISAGVMKRIGGQEERLPEKRPARFRWGMAVTLAGLFLLMIVSYSIFFLEKGPGAFSAEGEKKVRIRSVQIGGKEAKTYFFDSGDKDRVVVWVQKYQEG